MFDSDQGEKIYQDCTSDYTITDFRDLLPILGLPCPGPLLGGDRAAGTGQ